MHINLVWFRNDLRVHDNSALHFACQCDLKKTIVLALFISTPKQWQKNFMAPKKAFLIYKNVIFLQREIIKLGINFYYHESTDYLTSISYIINFCKIHQVNSIFFNYEYGFFERKRDEIVKEQLKKIMLLLIVFMIQD